MAEALRDRGVSVVMHCGGGNFKSQMRKADASGARFAVIIGDDEAKAGVLSLKALRGDAAQTQVRVEEAVALIRDA